MSFINFKLAFAGIALVAFIAFAMNYDHLKEQNKILAADNEQYAIQINDHKAIIDFERKNAAELNARQKETEHAKKVIEYAYNDKLKCISNNTCGVSIKWKTATCSGLSGSISSESGSDDRTRSDLADLSRWDASMERSINKNHQLIKDLQREYAIKSDPNYCKPN